MCCMNQQLHAASPSGQVHKIYADRDLVDCNMACPAQAGSVKERDDKEHVREVTPQRLILISLVADR